MIVTAWVAEYALVGREGAPAANSYRVKVLSDGEERASFDISELEALGTHQIVVLGKQETGPRLLDVIEAAGIDAFARVEISGAAVRDVGYLVLQAADIDENVLLDVANRGTVKVVGPDIPWEARVRDVLEINVKGAAQ